MSNLIQKASLNTQYKTPKLEININLDFTNFCRKKNGINENCERSQKRDVTDVAGGTRNHRKVLQPTLPLSKDTITTTESKSITSEIGNTRSTRSSRSRGSNRAVVNYNEEKVRHLKITLHPQFKK